MRSASPPPAALPAVALLAATLLAALVAAREARPPAGPVLHDLVERFPLARVGREDGVIRFGRPRDAEHLLTGWSRPDERRRFRWGTGEVSALQFDLLEPRDLEVTLRGRALDFPGAPPQRVRVALNQRIVGELEMSGPEVGEHRLVLPAERLRRGRNRLVFRYAWSRRPTDVLDGVADRRPLAVQWHELRFAGVAAASDGEPRVAGEDGLVVPAGVQLSWFLELPAGAAVALGERHWRGEGEGRLELLVEPAGGDARVVAARGGPGPGERLDLGLSERSIVRLALRAVVAPGAGGSWRGVRVEWLTVVGERGRRSAAGAPREPAGAVDAPGRRPGRRPHVLVYLVDTLRADRLGCYGYERPVSPHLDAFAERATLFEKAIAQSSWTRPTVASMLTGLWPPAHGVHLRRDALSEEAVTLAEILDADGYHTAAIAANPNVSRPFGFGQGFRDFVSLHRRNRSDVVNRRAFAWLDEGWDGETPFFLYLHTVDPHDPYDPPEEFRRRFAPDVPAELGASSRKILRELRLGDRPVTDELLRRFGALYDAEIAANDAAFGELLGELESRGLLDETVVVFLSDHGEEFFDHGGWTHGHTLHAEAIDVPLVIRLPGQREGRRVGRPVQQIDLMPTVLDLVGIEPPAGLEGRSLVPWLRGEVVGASAERRLFAFLRIDRVDRPGEVINERAGVVGEEWKLARVGRGEPHLELYRWRDDPRERVNLAPRHPVVAGYLETLLRERLLAGEGRLAATEAVLDAEVEEGLRALGYLE